MQVRFTDQFARRAVPEGRCAPIYMNLEVIGFGIQARRNRPVLAALCGVIVRG
jgi:hypothetical protein